VRSRRTKFEPVRTSLEDILGGDYVEAACGASAFLRGEKAATAARKLAAQKIDFFPTSVQGRLLDLLPAIGSVCSGPLASTARGASTAEFVTHTNTAVAPLSGFGYYRLSEDGRLFLTSKCEHYHASLGHAFPGFRLLEHARRLGIPNATHNNTRGFITRRLEEELVRAAAGIRAGDRAALGELLDSASPTALNRVLNLETGSLAAEAALKLVLSRFYKLQPERPAPQYAGRVPVVFVIGDDYGSLSANYHGTTILAQIMRGMWPELIQCFEKDEFVLIRSVPPNDCESLEVSFQRYDSGRYKAAGFFYEPIMMNYGGRRLSEAFVRRIHELCDATDTPVVVDEIQTCVWAKELFFFREYGVRPSAVVLGKGFSGGEYAASRVLFSADLDSLPQFGALVTNGQEEIASLAYLITMRWAEANAAITNAVGEYYEARLGEVVAGHQDLIRTLEGRRHLEGMFFHNLEAGKAFAESLNRVGLDISVQTYKVGCPPSALTKLPLIAGFEVVDAVIEKMEAALGGRQ
jgi:acetylornithine/succinyldiaminopimelate/putrescine aminotransferase